MPDRPIDTYSGAATMPWIVHVALVLVVTGFWEEIGRRGFLVHRWARGLSLLRT